MVKRLHEYSIDVDKKRVYFSLAGISILGSMLFTFLLNCFINVIPFIEFTVSLTAFTLFGILHNSYNKRMWKWRWLNKIGIENTPNLNGIWEGELHSSYYSFKKAQPATLIIEQSWTQICIKGEFNKSSSSSDTASLKINSGGGVKLLYSYYNDKAPEFYKEGTKNHRGYANLEITEDVMKGNYFNDPTNNPNHGKLKLDKQE